MSEKKKSFYNILPLSNATIRIYLFAVFGIGILYSNSLDAPFHFDDNPNILQNESIRIERADWDQIKKPLRENFISERQLPFITFAFNYLAGGYNPFGYHVFNVVLHNLNVWLVFLFAFKTLSLPSLKLNRCNALSAASLTALMWAVHPIQTNVAVYVVQRMTSLATIFFLASFIAYINGRIFLPRSRTRSFFWFLLAAICGVLSLMCKQNTVFLPFLILFYDCFFFSNKNSGKRFFLGLGAFAAFLFIVFILFGGTDLLQGELEVYEWREYTLTERLLTEMRVVFHYLSLLIIPHPDRLTLFYDGYPISRSLFSPWTTAASFFGLVLTGIYITWTVLTKRFIYAFGILWYFANQIVESSFIPLELVFEHRAYLPSIGIFLIASVWVTRLISFNPKRRPIAVCLIFLFVMFEMFGTLTRNMYWSNEVVFYKDALEKSPKSIRVLISLSHAYKDAGAFDLSKEYMEKAVKLGPEDLNTLAFYFLLLKQRGKEDEAGKVLRTFDHLLESGRYYIIHTVGIDIVATHFFAFEKDYERAARYTEYLVKLQPVFGFYFKLGMEYLMINKAEKALESFEKVIQDRPYSARYNFYLGLTHKILGHDKEAMNYIEKTLKLSPSSNLIKEMHKIMGSSAWSGEKIVEFQMNDSGIPQTAMLMKAK